MEQSPELREAHEAAKAVQEGRQAAKTLQRQGRHAGQRLAQLAEADHIDLPAVHDVIRELRRNAFAAANRLNSIRPPAQPREAQQHGIEAA